MPLVSLAAAFSLSCGAAPNPEPAPLSRRQLTPAAIPAALRASYLQARQRELAAAYSFQLSAVAPGSFVARNAMQGGEATLDDQGLRLRQASRADAAAVSLSLQLYGCAGAPRSAVPTAPHPGQEPGRVEYQRDGIKEWYENGPLGLEHGFTLEHDPGCADSGKLAFSLELGGALTAALIGQGSATRVELRDPHRPEGHPGPPIFVYSDLFALDADGKELPSRMSLVGMTLRLEVDATGARYPVTVDPIWTQQAVLRASDGATNDYFGAAVAIDGDTAVIGAPEKTVGANARQGQAYVFVRSGTTWMQQAILVDSMTGAADDYFGIAVALSGDTIVVGADLKDVGAHSQQGQAYVFVRSGTSWTQQAILVDAVTGDMFDDFGAAVVLQGDTAVIGCDKGVLQGQAYVFVRSGTSWAQQAVLKEPMAGTGENQFARSLAIDGDTVVIGDYAKTVGTNREQGSAYVFVRSGAAWSLQATLVDSVSGAADDQFGIAVAVSRDTAVVGAYNKDVGTHRQQGQVYVFVRAGTAWSQQAILTDVSTGAAGDFFGYSVALRGDTAAIGAAIKKVGLIDRQGQAYIFARSGSTWSQKAILVDSVSGAAEDKLGINIAMSGDAVLLGVPEKKVGGNLHQGQAYVFASMPGPNGTPCTLGSECASTFCVDGFCCDTACGGGKDGDCQSCRGDQTGDPDGTCSPVAWAVRYSCRAAAGVCDQTEFCDGVNVSCPADAVYQTVDHHLCRAATYCSRDTYCDGSSTHCPPSLCITPRF